MKILFVSSEVAPFAKTGGLGDVSAALPKALHALGHDVRIVVPMYARVLGRGHAFTEVVPEIMFSLGEEFGWRGFAYPRMAQRHGPVIGSLLLGCVWAIW